MAKVKYTFSHALDLSPQAFQPIAPPQITLTGWRGAIVIKNGEAWTERPRQDGKPGIVRERIY